MGARTIIVLWLVVLGLSPFGIAAAQPPTKIPRIGVLIGGPAAARLYEVFQQALRELGYVEGHNVVLELREAEGHEQMDRDDYPKAARIKNAKEPRDLCHTAFGAAQTGAAL
jgi:hypothetical protein